MNPILAYELKYISFCQLKEILWDMGPNAILQIGEKCFAFYCKKANELHSYEHYILKYGSGLNDESEWYCE